MVFISTNRTIQLEREFGIHTVLPTISLFLAPAERTFIVRIKPVPLASRRETTSNLRKRILRALVVALPVGFPALNLGVDVPLAVGLRASSLLSRIVVPFPLGSRRWNRERIDDLAQTLIDHGTSFCLEPQRA
jgi:hypothetical protein